MILLRYQSATQSLEGVICTMIPRATPVIDDDSIDDMVWGLACLVCLATLATLASLGLVSLNFKRPVTLAQFSLFLTAYVCKSLSYHP